MNYNKDLKKLEYRHLKDCVIGKIFLEMFVVQHTFTGKMHLWKKSQRTQKIQFLEILCDLFPWSDRLDQERVLKPSKNSSSSPSKPQNKKISPFLAAKIVI
jgi:hypothetical protein